MSLSRWVVSHHRSIVDVEGNPKILDFRLARFLAQPVDTVVSVSQDVIASGTTSSTGGLIALGDEAAPTAKPATRKVGGSLRHMREGDLAPDPTPIERWLTCQTAT